MSVRIFGHYVSVPPVLLLLAEAAIHTGAVFVAAALRFLDPGRPLYVEGDPGALLPRALLYAATLSGIMTAFGLYGSTLDKDDREYQARFLASFPVGAVVMTVIFYIVPASMLGRGVLALSLVISFTLAALAREVFFRVIGHEALKRRVLVLGSGSRAAAVEALWRKLGAGAGFQLVGFVLCGEEQPSVDASCVIGECSALRTIVGQHRVDEIIVGVRDRRTGQFPTAALLECRLAGVSVVDLPTFFEEQIGYVELGSLTPSWMIFSGGFSASGTRKTVKRAFDVSVSVVMLIATLPVMAAAALAVWQETGRPILYRQQRVGESGRLFEMLKFRSMRAEAEQDGIARWAMKDDHRVTRVGKFLRMSRIDELPQLINVLRGDMSFVGPRPERPRFVQELSRKLPFYASRHSVKPGITGWAQIRHPYAASVEDALKKLQFDLYYLKNQSLFLDLVILLQTIHVVLFGEGAR